MSETTTVEVEILAVTDRAYRVDDGKVQAWIPRSQVENDEGHERGELVELVIPEWLAIDRELA